MKDGKRVWVKLETKDEAEAIRRALKIRDNPELTAAEPFLDEIDRFIAYQRRLDRYSPDSADNKKIILRTFVSALPPQSTPKNVTHDQIERWYTTRRTKVAVTTAQSDYWTVRAFFRWCVEQAHIRHDNPAKNIELGTLPAKGRREFCTKAQKNKLIEAAKLYAPPHSNMSRDDLLFVLYCGFEAGMRFKEISEARVYWFTSDKVHIHRTDTFVPKDRDERNIPLTKAFKAFLKGYLAGKDPMGFAMLPQIKHGKWRYRYDFRKPFKKFIDAQGMGKITRHQMRHSFASILGSAGVSIFKIAEWLGDDIEITHDNYAKLAPGDRDIHKLT